jgi:succinoglycan biosynthesis protein ExoO
MSSCNQRNWRQKRTLFAAGGPMSDAPEFQCAVIIPVHNKRPHIARSVDSVLKQTLPPAEIILIDDASSDGSSEILRSYSGDRMQILHRATPGAGGYAARNLGIRHARSPWIAFLDADDEWSPQHLQTVARGAHGAGVFTGFRTRLPDGSAMTSAYSRAGPKPPRDFDFDQMLDLWLRQRACPMWTGALAFRREVLLKAGLFPEGRCKRGGDKDLWLRASAQGTMVGFSEVTATYHADSVNMVTRQSATDQRHCMWPSIEALMPGASPARVARLKRLYNMQVWEYVYSRWRAGANEPECAEGFFRDEEPLRYFWVRLLQGTASPPLAAALNTVSDMRRGLQARG